MLCDEECFFNVAFVKTVAAWNERNGLIHGYSAGRGIHLLHHGQSRGTNCLKIHLQPPYHPLYRGRKTGEPGKKPSKHGLNSTLPYSTLPYTLPFSTLFSTLLYPTPLYSTLFSTLPYSTLPYPTLPYSTLPYPTLYPTLLYSTLPYSTLPYPTLLTWESTRGYSQVVTHPSSNPVINFGAQRWEATPQQYTPASVLLNPLFLINFTEQNEVCRLSGFAQLKTNSNKNKIQHATSPFLWRKSYQNRV